MKRVLLFMMLASLGCGAYGAVVGLNANVVRVLSDATRFGACMALVDQPFSGLGVNCPNWWVTFSCSGDFVSKDVAKQNFEVAQIAFLTRSGIYLEVDDTKKHNGYCFVRRIDLL